MARPINTLFDEVKYELLKILLLSVFLEAAIVFLGTYLVLSLFSMPLWYSGVVAALYFGSRFLYKSRGFDLKRIEERNPHLKEMLRTANDNKNVDSLMSHALFSEVINKMRRVSSGTFLSMEMILRRLAAIVILSVVLVGLAFFNIDIAQFDNPLEGPMNRAGDFFRSVTGADPEPEAIDLSDSSLYGDHRMATLGDEDLQLQINPSLNQIDFSNVQDPDVSEGAIKDFPGSDARAVSGSAYEGGLEDVADRRTAADYAQRIRR